LTNEELDELRAFLRSNISSFEELEALMLLMGTPQQPWSVREVAAALNFPEESVEAALDALSSNDLLQRASGRDQSAVYRFQSPERSGTVLAKLQQAYGEQRLTIFQIMNANALERVRSSAARRLADAFRLDRSKK